LLFDLGSNIIAMKNVLGAIAADAVLAITAVHAADTSGISHPHPLRYMPMLRSPDWWNSGELTGDWLGLRNVLYDEGVSFFSNYTNNIAGNPVGGKSAGFTYCDNLAFGLDLDLANLIGWKGASFTVSGLNRNGSSLSEKNIGNQFTVQQVFWRLRGDVLLSLS
jgi:carbohydrate-selective porin OprB